MGGDLVRKCSRALLPKSWVGGGAPQGRPHHSHFPNPLLPTFCFGGRGASGPSPPIREPFQLQCPHLPTLLFERLGRLRADPTNPGAISTSLPPFANIPFWGWGASGPSPPIWLSFQPLCQKRFRANGVCQSLPLGGGAPQKRPHESRTCSTPFASRASPRSPWGPKPTACQWPGGLLRGGSVFPRLSHKARSVKRTIEGQRGWDIILVPSAA